MCFLFEVLIYLLLNAYSKSYIKAYYLLKKLFNLLMSFFNNVILKDNLLVSSS